MNTSGVTNMETINKTKEYLFIYLFIFLKNI